jgi:hypothetical protein
MIKPRVIAVAENIRRPMLSAAYYKVCSDNRLLANKVISAGNSPLLWRNMTGNVTYSLRFHDPLPKSFI